MKRIVKTAAFALLAAAFALPMAACGGAQGDEEGKYRECLSDTTFQEGLSISGLQSMNVSRTWWKYRGTADETVMPYWELGQYCDLSTTRFRKGEDGKDAWRYDATKNDLTLGTIFDDGYGIEGTDGGYETLTNQSGSKYVSVDRATGEINLNVDTSKEYIDEAGNISPRKNGEDWVHLILGQSAGGVIIADCSEIWVELDFCLTQTNVIDETGGASQFQWIFSVKDMNSVVGDYFWFNITLYDNRYSVFPGGGMFDSGKADATNKFIYSTSSDKLYEGEIQSGKDYSVRVDIRPLLEEAFGIAKEKGALEQSEFSSMALNSLNIGWEVTHVAQMGVKLSHISLKTKKI